LWVLVYIFSYSVSPAATNDKAEWRLIPSVVFQEFSSEKRCKDAKSTIEATLKHAGEAALMICKRPARRTHLKLSLHTMWNACRSECYAGTGKMRDFRSVIMSAFFALAAWTATVNPSQADTGTVHVLFGTAGVVAGVGNGKGTLTFHGKTYPFEVSGASLGATLVLTVSELVGQARNLRTPGDLAGNYIAVGAGGAVVGGIGVARLRNANGVILMVRGPKLGAGLSVNLARITITMM